MEYGEAAVVGLQAAEQQHHHFSGTPQIHLSLFPYDLYIQRDRCVDYSSDEVMEEAFGAVPEAAAEVPVELPNVEATHLLEFKPDPADIESHPDPYASIF
jgi:hypothetical protein